MDVNFRYLCIGINYQGNLYFLVDKNDQCITVSADGLCSVDTGHKKFLEILNIDPKFIQPKLIDVVIEKDEFNIYYGCILSLELNLIFKGYEFKRQEYLFKLTNEQLEIYKKMALELLP